MRLSLRFITAIPLFLASCSDPSGPGAPRSILLTGGGEQVGVVGTAFPAPVTVTVYDGSSRPVPGVAVTWTVESGGGSLDRTTSVTDRAGRASVRWTAGKYTEPQRLRASAGAAGSVSIELRVEAGAPDWLWLTPDGLVAEPGTELPQPVGVQVFDEYRNFVPDQLVRFSASAGILSDTLVQSDSVGTAFVTWALGQDPGEHALTVTLPGTNLGAVVRAWAIAAADVPLLENGVPVTGISASTGAPRLYRLPVPAGASRLEVRTEASDGNADLFVRAGAYPGWTVYDCESTTAREAEQCTIQDPAAGDWFVLVNAWLGFTNLTLTAEWFVPGA